MARQLRVLFKGAIYHVMLRGVERRPLFRDNRDRERFVEQLADSVELFGVRLYLYCLMSNHVHLLVETPNANLSAFMQRLQTAYTVYFNHRHKRVGHLMQGRYRAQLVQGDEYLAKLSRYIHLNPVFVGREVKKPLKERVRLLRAYPWSSYRGYAGLVEPEDFVAYAPVLAGFERGSRGKTASAYRAFVEAALAKTDEEFLEVLRNSAWGIGDDRFRAKIKRAHGVAVKQSNRREDASFRRIGVRHTPAAVLGVVGKVFGLKPAMLRTRSYGQPARRAAMAAFWKYTALNQRDIATFFGIGTGSAVCRAVGRLARERAEDSALNQKCANIDRLLER